MKRATVKGRGGADQRSSRWATLRLVQKPIRRGPSLFGMAIIDQGRNISRLQPSASSAVPCRQGPSHWLV